MIYAEITGWGRCLPPAVLSNRDIETIMRTSDDWIFSRSGIRERRISHVSAAELGVVAGARALAAAGVAAGDLDLILYATSSPDELVPNNASIVQNRLGAVHAGALDVNAACSGFLYAFNMASDMIRVGSVRTILLIGSERLSSLMNWERRESAVLFGDGAGAFVLQASADECGYFAGKLGCVPNTRELLAIPDFGLDAIAQYRPLDISIDFSGPEIFKHAVKGMGDACEAVLAQGGVQLHELDLIVPHQANLRIVEAVARRLGTGMDRVVLTLEKYANTSTSSIPIALCEALEGGRVRSGMTILFTAFGAGLTWAASLLRWGRRLDPLGTADIELPPCEQTGLELVRAAIARRARQQTSV
ncbi:MAG: beta-ketoacyl-ACP synthase 3 [Pseudomonadales bacterium]|nr:beta-ketoacyl-ACP synthase 3 [Pseudomonadales bacterium]